jgi:hypothetical protein
MFCPSKPQNGACFRGVLDGGNMIFIHPHSESRMETMDARIMFVV